VDATDTATILTKLLAGIPEVSVGEHIHHANFLVGKKVFAFVKGSGVAVKLPRKTAEDMVKTNKATPLFMGKRVMKEWVVIEHEDPEAFRSDLQLFMTSIGYVSSTAG
jgi:hypothetical protein